jgi:hypothetical protein
MSNPLLDRIQLPGETFTLPSGGLFYTDELDTKTKNGELHVYPMSAFDEIVMKSPDMLFSGRAVEEVFARCIPQVLKPTQLLAKDVDFLLICLRKVSYGTQLEITATHNCPTATEHSYLVPVDDFIKSSKRIDPSTLGSLFNVEFSNKQRLTLRPITFDNFLKLMQTPDEDASIEKIKENLYTSLLSVIQSVDEITDPTMIREWLTIVPAEWIHLVYEKIETVTNWGPTFITEVVCKDCGETFKVTAPLNPLAFFG